MNIDNKKTLRRARAAVSVGALLLSACLLPACACSTNGAASYAGTVSTSASSSSASADTAASTASASGEDTLDIAYTDDTPAGANERKVSDSASLVSGSAVYAMLADRGFDNVLVSADFALDGSVIDSHLVDSSSADVFPQYYTALDTDAGVFWLLEVDEGSLIALPIRTADTILERRFMFVEGDTDTVTLYNAASNTFSDWTQDQLGNTTIISVPRIDRDLLEGYTIDWFLERS